MNLMPHRRIPEFDFGVRIRWFLKDKYRLTAAIAVIVCAVVFLGALFINSIMQNKDKHTLIKGVGYYEPFSEHTEYDLLVLSVSVDKKSHIMYLGDNASVKIEAQVYPPAMQGESIKYISDDENIATVDEYGVVTAHNPGVAKITVSVKNGDNSAKKIVTVRVIQPVDGIFLPKTSVTLYMGSSGQLLEYRISPLNASNQSVSWASKDENIVTVDENGHIRPVNIGMTEVTATTKDGKYSAKCFVTVVNYAVNVEGVEITNEYKDNAYLKVGESMWAVVSVTPSNARNRTLRWESTNPSAATVSQSGKITAVAEGNTQIVVTSVNGKSDVINLTIQPSDKVQSGTYVPASGGSYASNGDVLYTQYDITLSELVNIQMQLDPPPKNNGGKSTASREETKEHMDPTSYSEGAYKYQFLDLSHYNGISEVSLNSFLSDKGILRGHANDFIEAAKRYNISEIYLVAHACLETGNGTSKLSTGVNVNGQTVYNMYGIGAYDANAVSYGSKRAYDEGWTSVSSAIIGGAEWISKNYINASSSRQNTLYKMRWNPQRPGQHQYATDIGWATSQAINIEKIFRLFPEAIKTYDVPVFNDTVPPAIDTSY